MLRNRKRLRERSPYPALSILNEYEGSRGSTEHNRSRTDERAASKVSAARKVPLPPSQDSLDSSKRAQRRKEKRPASRASTVQNVLLPSSHDVLSSNGDIEILSLHAPAVRRMNAEAIARDRALLDNTSDARRRRQRAQTELRELKDRRVDEDGDFASNLAARFAAEDADHEYAKGVQQQQFGDDTQMLLEAQREVAEQEEEARAAAESARALLKTAEDQQSESKRRRKALAAQIAAEKERIRSLIEKAQGTTESPVINNKSKESTAPPYAAMPTFKDRVVIQRLREADIKRKGSSRYPEQGIMWDSTGKPVEVGPAPIRGSSVGTCGGRKQDPQEKIKPVKTEDPSSSKVRLPPKKEEGSKFYLKSGTAPPSSSGGGSSSDASSNSSSSSSKSDDSGTYRPETNYSRSDDTDSVFGDEDRSRNSSHKTRHKHRRHFSASSDSSDDSSEVSGDLYDEQGSSRSRERESRSERGPARTPRRRPDESERAYRRRRRRNSRRNHHSHGASDRRHRVEEGDPTSAGVSASNLKRWRASLHHHYEKFLKNTLGKRSAMSSVFDENRNLKFPVPPTYSGSADINKFDEHILTIGRWMELMGLGGRQNDHKRILTHGFYLSGLAKDWYETQVVGLYRVKNKWTYKEVVLGLFDRFINTGCVQKATDTFWTAKYSAEIGIIGYYNQLMTAARRMVKRPDSYTFKSHLMSNMPSGMFHALTERNITAEYSKIKEILDYAVNYEWHQSIRDRYAEQRRTRRSAESSKRPETKAKDSPRLAMGRDVTKRYRFVKREPIRNEPPTQDYRPDSARGIPRETPRPVGRDGGGKGGNHVKFRPFPKPSQGAKPPVPKTSGSREVKCYSCGGPHYRNDCPHNKDRDPILYHGREIVDDNEEREHKAPDTAGPTTPEEPEERLNQVLEDEDSESPLHGEQYDSDYTLEECTEYSEYDNDERCYNLVVEEEDDLPVLMSENEDNDTGSDMDSCYDADNSMDTDSVSENDDYIPVNIPSVPTTRREPTLDELGLFGVCDDYSDEEFVTDGDIDALARDMANCLIQTRDAEIMLEYFSAARVADDVRSQASQKRGVYLKRLKEPRPRPTRAKAENFCLTAYVKLNGKQAFTLFDSGCTTEACSPEFARVANIPVFPIQTEVTLQLGTAGSRSKINHGMMATLEYDDIKSEEYLDIVNLDRFDMIVGTKFMRKHKISLDFEWNTVRVAGVPSSTLTEKEENGEVKRRNAARRIAAGDYVPAPATLSSANATRMSVTSTRLGAVTLQEVPDEEEIAEFLRDTLPPELPVILEDTGEITTATGETIPEITNIRWMTAGSALDLTHFVTHQNQWKYRSYLQC
ncbi:hypothetical protein B0H12DRAFT_1077821 [Mycena haematopus]|nr:hypothetical protein B0H12DRAFT_1077821 [Mycena haematopus]